MANVNDVAAATDSDLEREFANHDKVLGDYFFYAIGIDGIVIDPDKAADMTLGCKCVNVVKEKGGEETLCWKRGVIGLLTQEQMNQFCPPNNRTFPQSSEGLAKRLEGFEHASEICEAAGATTLEERLACMAAELQHRTQNIGEIG